MKRMQQQPAGIQRTTAITKVAKPSLLVTSDVVPEGLHSSIVAGHMVRVEVGAELKSLMLWAIEQQDNECGASLVVRDGHTLKKKVSWRPSAQPGVQLCAISIAFVPAHQYGTLHANATIWTSWWSPQDRLHHQFVLFDPVSRQAQRSLRYDEVFTSAPAFSLYAPVKGADQRASERGVRFAHDKGFVQPPLALFASTTNRMHVVHQIESRGTLDVAVSTVIPHTPFSVTDMCKLPFSCSNEKRNVVSSIGVDNAVSPSLIVIVTDRLQCAVVRIAARNATCPMHVVRTFRPRDFLNVASNPYDATHVSVEWCKAEMEKDVILPEYFHDPIMKRDITEPRRFAAAQPPRISSAASQRSSSLASTVPQRVVDRSDSTDALRHDVRADMPAAAEPLSQQVFGPTDARPVLRPINHFLIRAVEALARLHGSLLISRYFQSWASKTSKHPNWCLDGWASSNQAVLILPLTAIVDVETPSHLNAFLRTCHDASVEIWIMYQDGTNLSSYLEMLRTLDVQRTIGQLICVPSLVDVERQQIYLRHLSHRSVLPVLISVAWMMRATFLGVGDNETYVACPRRLFYPSAQMPRMRSQFLQRLSAVIHLCRRVHSGKAEYLWDAMSSRDVSEMLSTVKECSPNGRTFVDLVTISL